MLRESLKIIINYIVDEIYKKRTLGSSGTPVLYIGRIVPQR
jgi:hypothetical protein